MGPGFALENRIIISQVLSRLFHDNKVLRLAPFFIKYQDYLRKVSFYNRDDPEVVILSPGPTGETYFEQAFLSRYFGYPMFESGDLTVRDNKVFVKTLGGLEPVDVLLRWIKDLDCDPLALRTNSTSGVSGLIHAMRQKKVSVVNPIGAGVIESRVFSGYLSGLCNALLGEAPILSDVPSLWCGEPDALNRVLSDSGRYIFKSGFGTKGSKSFDTDLMSDEEKNEFLERIRFSPYEFTAREKTALSTVPTLSGGKELVSKSYICRFFIAAGEDGFHVMPGGLAKIAGNFGSFFSGDDESLTKDIWVLSEGPVEQVSLMSRLDKAVEIRRRGDLPSRIADNLLWLGIHLETAENRIRLFRSIFQRLSSEIPFTDMAELPVLLKIAADMEMVSLEKMETEKELHLFNMQEELLASIFDRKRPFSLASVLKNIHLTAMRVRERLSQDSWRILTKLEKTLIKTTSVQWIQISDTYDMLSDALITLSAFSGMSMESMTRGPGWRFMDMGKRIIRAQDLVSIIQSAVIDPIEDHHAMLDALLELADSSITYRHRYRTYLQTAPAMDLLLADDINPKSLAFQLAALSRHVDHLPGNGVRKYSSPEEKILLKILTAVRLADVAETCGLDDSGKRPRLDELLSFVKTGIIDFSHQVTRHYLTRIPTTQHFSSLIPAEKRRMTGAMAMHGLSRSTKD